MALRPFCCRILNSAELPVFPASFFVLAVELLAIKIRDCKDIKKIRNWSAVNDINMESVVKIALYADQITLFLPNEMFLERSDQLDCFPDFLQFAAQR